MTQSGLKCKFPLLHLFAVKICGNYIFSTVFYCFRPLWRHNLPNIDITVLIFCIQPHFTMIQHLWKVYIFSISRTYLKIGVWSSSKLPIWGRVKFRAYIVMIDVILILINKCASKKLNSSLNWLFLLISKLHGIYQEIIVLSKTTKERKN